MRTILARLFMVLAITGIFSCNSSIPPKTKSTTVYTHHFKRGYQTAYPLANTLYYYDIKRVKKEHPDSVFIQFSFRNTFDNFNSYSFSQGSEQNYTSKENIFAFRFNKKVKQYTYKRVNIKVNAGELSKNYTLKISFDPASFLAEKGHTANNAVFVHDTDIQFLEVLHEEFLSFFKKPTVKEKNTIQEQFGNFVKDAKSEQEKIDRLAIAVLDFLEPSIGVPSDSMNGLTPFQQFERVKARKDEVWCGNIADIFTFTCLCFDIPARMVGLGNNYKTGQDPEIYHADFHSMSEVYNKETRRWHLADLTFKNIKITDPNNNCLNLSDFLHLYNTPGWKKQLTLHEYNPKAKKVIPVIALKSQNDSLLRSFYKMNTKFNIVYRKNGKVGFFEF